MPVRVGRWGTLLAAAMAAACSGTTTTAPSNARPNLSAAADSTGGGGKGKGTIVLTVLGGTPAGDSAKPQPLGSATVFGYRIDSSGLVRSIGSDTTLANGTARFASLAAGAYSFRVLPPPGTPYAIDTSTHVTFKAGGTLQLTVVLPYTLPPPSGPGAIRGFVAGDSVPGDTTNLVYLANAVVTTSYADSNGQRTPVGVDTTGVGGGFSFASLTPGTYVLYAKPYGTTWASESLSVAVSPGSTAFVPIVLPLRSK